MTLAVIWFGDTPVVPTLLPVASALGAFFIGERFAARREAKRLAAEHQAEEARWHRGERRVVLSKAVEVSTRIGQRFKEAASSASSIHRWLVDAEVGVFDNDGNELDVPVEVLWEGADREGERYNAARVELAAAQADAEPVLAELRLLGLSGPALRLQYVVLRSDIHPLPFRYFPTNRDAWLSDIEGAIDQLRKRLEAAQQQLLSEAQAALGINPPRPPSNSATQLKLDLDDGAEPAAPAQ